MQYTDHYNLNLPEGTDIVNPLVQDNPNYTAIDGALYANKLRVVGNATEVKSGTVHAITRSDSDIDVIRFTATGDWITGDTMTVDGTPVSVYLPDGSAPLTGAYIINTEVIAIINGSRVTLYGAQKLPAYTASDISYDNTQSGLSAADVQSAIDEVESKIDTATSAVITTGVEISRYNKARILNVHANQTFIANTWNSWFYIPVADAPSDSVRSCAYTDVGAAILNIESSGLVRVFIPGNTNAVQIFGQCSWFI